jgi:hypothetical protein
VIEINAVIDAMIVVARVITAIAMKFPLANKSGFGTIRCRLAQTDERRESESGALDRLSHGVVNVHHLESPEEMWQV